MIQAHRQLTLNEGDYAGSSGWVSRGQVKALLRWAEVSMKKKKFLLGTALSVSSLKHSSPPFLTAVPTDVSLAYPSHTMA